MFKNKRNISGNEYEYIEHSYRIGSKVNKISLYIPKHKSINLNEFLKFNKENIDEITKKRVELIKKNLATSEFYNYGNQLEYIERTKLLYQIFFKRLNKKDRENIMEDYLRRFIINSMNMEGGTISYEIAKAIDNNKNFSLNQNIDENDIPLYKQLKEAYFTLENMRLRTGKQIKELHHIIYKKTYPFAGKFRIEDVTFGKGHLAKTYPHEKIKEGIKKVFENYNNRKNKMYDFDRIILFHKDFQKVHPFKDGNSRLGRLIMIAQLLSFDYPPLLIRGSSSERYRTSLVKAINEDHTIPLFKFYYEAYKKTFEKFWKPAIEKAMQEEYERLT